jgi:hypothetical protein
MKRVEANRHWSLFCPNEAPSSHEVNGEEFEALYEKYEKEARQSKRRYLTWQWIVELTSARAKA